MYIPLIEEVLSTPESESGNLFQTCKVWITTSRTGFTCDKSTNIRKSFMKEEETTKIALTSTSHTERQIL
jgi:hypothetical protein